MTEIALFWRLWTGSTALNSGPALDLTGPARLTSSVWRGNAGARARTSVPRGRRYKTDAPGSHSVYVKRIRCVRSEESREHPGEQGRQSYWHWALTTTRIKRLLDTLVFKLFFLWRPCWLYGKLNSKTLTSYGRKVLVTTYGNQKKSSCYQVNQHVLTLNILSDLCALFFFFFFFLFSIPL